LLAKAGFAADDARVALTVPVSSSWKKPVMAEFIPLEDGIIPNAHTVDIDYRPGILTLNFPRGSADLPERWNGVLKLQWKDGQTAAHTLTAERQAQLPAPAQSLLVLLGLAFVGGLLLNIMPCVLPVLSLKALAIVKKSHAAPQLVRAQGLAYTAGVVLSFLAIAGAMLALKASGEAVGWGFQLQSVPMVATLAILMALVSLNMAGAFHLPPMLGHIMVTHDGLRGSFLTGVLAVAVATPCTAPFMATAVGATLTLAPALSLLIFAAMGVGLASPFLLISFWPAAQRLLPKPGHWMVRLRQILAIPMAATALWLFYVLLQLLYPTPMKQDGYHLITPVAYSERALADLRAQQKPVFVDATAAWCLTCKVNERVALRPERVQHAFKDQNITLMIADWTTRDDAIAAYLATFGRNGVPLYVYYPPGQPPVVLPQVLTPSLVLDAIKNESTQPHN
jgi:thiol:disulfide interchange protein DsbD